MPLGYLYSRYPVLSQTFCDTEMLALERLGYRLVVGSVYPPLTSLRHAHLARLRAPIHYAPPQPIVQLWEEKIRSEGRWPETLVQAHDRKYGGTFKATTRARNACYFAELFAQNGVEHFHVHFANRAAHTALFLKAIANIPFSVTAHGQDFMSDLGSNELLGEICEAAEFVAVETEFSGAMLAQRCPESASKIHRVYNGMDLAVFPGSTSRGPHAGPLQILSVGRLVPFKGFAYLIEACEQLRQRNISFRCQIIGDGPLRESLQRQIDELRLGTFVTLEGSWPRERVIERLRSTDVFALASTIDDAGASDVFPTVILEAMASERPVISTTVAGIPEAVVDKETGLLVPPGESGLFADALEALCRNTELRARYGAAGRERIENNFQIDTTLQPLVQQFEKHARAVTATRPNPSPAAPSPPRIAYLIDKWPGPVPVSIEVELLELKKRNANLTGFVCEFEPRVRLTPLMRRIALQLEFLPDAMAIEAEWQTNPELAQALEDDRAKDQVRMPADLFLRQARFAMSLRRIMAERNISHLHATSSRALLCGILLRKILGITLSASIEARPEVSRDVIQNALRHCVGGRIADRRISEQLEGSFIFDRAGSNQIWVRSLRWLKPITRIDLTRRARFWQEWAALLDRWSAEA